MSKLFKDFNKDVKDLLTKDTSKPGVWKVESKSKCKDDIMLNPVADNKGVSVNVEYNLPAYKLKTKTNVTPNNIKPKVTYDCSGHKVEATLNSLKQDSDFEVTYETKCCDLYCWDKVTRNGLEASASYHIANPGLDVGVGIKWGFSKGFGGWSAGVRWADKAGRVVDVVTADAKTYTTGVLFPVTVADHKVKLGAQVDCGNNKCTVQVGAEAALCCFTVKAAVDNKGKVVMTAIRQFAEKWKAAVSMESTECCKFGISLSRE